MNIDIKYDEKYIKYETIKKYWSYEIFHHNYNIEKHILTKSKKQNKKELDILWFAPAGLTRGYINKNNSYIGFDFNKCQEMHDWLDRNIGCMNWAMSMCELSISRFNYYFLFDNAKDAVMFKTTWC